MSAAQLEETPFNIIAIKSVYIDVLYIAPSHLSYSMYCRAGAGAMYSTSNAEVVYAVAGAAFGAAVLL